MKSYQNALLPEYGLGLGDRNVWVGLGLSGWVDKETNTRGKRGESLRNVSI